MDRKRTLQEGEPSKVDSFEYKLKLTLSGCENDPVDLPILGSHSLTVWSQLPVTTTLTSGQNSTHLIASSWFPSTFSVNLKKRRGQKLIKCILCILAASKNQCYSFKQTTKVTTGQNSTYFWITKKENWSGIASYLPVLVLISYSFSILSNPPL